MRKSAALSERSLTAGSQKRESDADRRRLPQIVFFCFVD
jgi:hypothetical protein